MASPPNTPFSVPIADGVVDQCDLGEYEAHERGRNWIAVVYPDRSVAGGLIRTWLDRAAGTCYDASTIKVGDYLEVGSDYVRFSGHKDRKRRYLRVLTRTDTHLTVRDEEVPKVATDIKPVNPVGQVLALLDSALRLVHKATGVA